MTKRAFLIACAVVIALVPFFGPGASLAAVGEAEEIDALPSKEAWHHNAPGCMSFVDCSALPPANPYPEDTLHVAASRGQETARTYLAFPALPLGAVLEEARLTLPVDTDPGKGSVTPAAANMVACLTEATFKPVKGSVEKPPKVDCKVREHAKYSPKREVFTVDLSRLVKVWDPSGRMALALLPAERDEANNDTWHVVFPAAGEESSDDPPTEGKDEREITATFVYSVSESSTDPIGTEFDFGGTTTGTDPSSSGGFDSSSGPSLSGSVDTGGLDPGTPGSGTAVVGSGTEPTDLGEQESQPVLAFTEGFAGPGFAYPIVWAMPLLILVGFAAVGRALTKELYRPND